MSRTMYPYPTLFGPIGLEVTRVRLDARPLEYTMISHTQQTVALHDVGREDWEEGSIDVRATLPERELADGPWSELSCVAILTEGATNARTVRRLVKDRASDTWQGSVPLLRSRHTARAVLTVQAVATIGGVRGRTIGRGDKDWVIDLESRTPVRDREIDIIPVDFRDGPHEWLRPYKDAPWLVETTGDMPAVYLNEAFEGLTKLLRGGGSSLEKATAALVNAQIVTEAWTVMFHSAVSDLQLDDRGRPQVPDGWRESVLRVMLPDILPGMSPEDAVAELQTRREEGYGWSELQPRIQYAAARRSQLPKNLATTLRTVFRSQEGATR